MKKETSTYLYHVTNETKAESILKDRVLLPGRGDHCLSVNDMGAVYLCSREDIPFWQLILGCSRVVRIPKRDIPQCAEFDYGRYKEFICRTPIQSKDIEDVSGQITKAELQKANTVLCCSYLWTISHLCMRYARYYHEGTAMDEIITETKTVLDILSHFNYMDVPVTELKKEMEKMVDACAYTFADTYCNTDTRLWEQLVKYPDDEFSEIRTELHDFIKENLKPVLFENTGGYIV